MVLKILTDEPVAVTRDGTALARLPAPPGFDASNSSWELPPGMDAGGSGWTFAATTGFLLIKFQHPGGVTRISF